MMKDTVDDEEAEVAEQQNSQDEGRLVQNVPRAFLLLNTPAAPGGRQPIRIIQSLLFFSFWGKVWGKLQFSVFESHSKN